MPIIRPPGTNLPIPHKSSPAQKAPVAPNSATNVAQSPATRPASATPTTVPLSALFKTLGLPNDKLSATILSFAKFFSLPLDPAMLASVRQQATRGLPGQPGNPASPAQQTPAQTPVPATLAQTMQAADSREAVALAVLAATDKGVKLSEKALAEYVDAIDPDRNSEHDNGEQGRGDEKKQQGKDQPDTEQSPLLNTLNKLPGKDGRRWLVFPFAFKEDGTDYRASLRLLLDETTAGRMSLDISSASQRWLFVADTGNPQKGIEQVQVYIAPERAALEQQKLASEVARFLEVPPERVSVRNSDFPFAPDCRADEFLPVDEAV